MKHSVGLDFLSKHCDSRYWIKPVNACVEGVGKCGCHAFSPVSGSPTNHRHCRVRFEPNPEATVRRQLHPRLYRRRLRLRQEIRHFLLLRLQFLLRPQILRPQSGLHLLRPRWRGLTGQHRAPFRLPRHRKLGRAINWQQRHLRLHWSPFPRQRLGLRTHQGPPWRRKRGRCWYETPPQWLPVGIWPVSDRKHRFCIGLVRGHSRL